MEATLDCMLRVSFWGTEEAEEAKTPTRLCWSYNMSIARRTSISIWERESHMSIKPRVTNPTEYLVYIILGYLGKSMQISWR